jgi:polynucleotide 5'-hydroxyl-kinase GRC3/NOL9
MQGGRRAADAGGPEVRRGRTPPRNAADAGGSVAAAEAGRGLQAKVGAMPPAPPSSSSAASVSPGRDWPRLLAGVERGTLLVAGPAGSGKSTLARWLVGQLARTLDRVALVDCDPGQTSVGVPGCVGMALTGPWEAPAAAWFVGARTPARHTLPLVVGAARLAELARARGAQAVVLDAPGLVDGALARVLHHHLAAAAGVDQVIGVASASSRRGGAAGPEGEALDDLLALLDAPERRVERVGPAAGARDRSGEERRRHREARFAAHLASATTRLFSPRRVVGADWRFGGIADLAPGTVLGLLDGEGFCLGLGVVEEVHADRLAVRTPVAEVPVVRLVAGDFRLDAEGRELPLRPPPTGGGGIEGAG